MPDSPFSPSRRALSVGLLMIVTIVAFEALGVGTALPDVARDLDGLEAYGWGFSAFMLASVVGMIASGQVADGRGPVRPFSAGVAVFAVGCATAAAAGTWGVLLAGRAIQGLGVGAISALVYVAVARAYPERSYGRMMALLSSAWVLPSLAGPPIAGLVAERADWRWVFAGLLPLVPVGMLLTLPGLRSLERPAAERTRAPNRVPAALKLAGGMALLLAALEVERPAAAAALVVVGAPLAAPSFARLLPAGTLRAARGLPAGVAVRGLMSIAYLGCDAFLPLALTRLRDLSLVEAGLVISVGSVSWSAGALLQGRLDHRDGGAGRRQRIVAGVAILLAGLGITALGVLSSAITPLVAAGGWLVAGLGMGMAYPSAGALALSHAPPGGEGAVSSALPLVETIAVALFTGAGGAAIALGVAHGWPASTAIALILAGGALAALAAVPTGRRV